MENEQTKLNVDLATLKPIEAKADMVLMDFSPLHNKTVKIERVSVIASTVGWDDNGKQVVLEVPREQLLVESENIPPKLGIKTDAEYRVRGWFNLIKQKDGTLGWSLHKKGNLNKFLNAQRVKTPNELIGKEVIVKVVDKKNSEGQTESRIYFLY
jgi:hypothetical protein